VGPRGPFSALKSSAGGSNCHFDGADVLHAVFEFGLLPWVDIKYDHEGELTFREHLELPAVPGE
jgi:hypothetical protein